jgi:hypothetical protein
MKTHWFFTNSETLHIWTYALGNHPSTTYRFENKKDFNRKIKAFLKDGYEFIKDQAKS